MGADRGVYAAGDLRVLQHLAVHALAHAVQALQLKLGTRLGTHLQDGCNGGGVVRGKLGIHGIGRSQECAGTG